MTLDERAATAAADLRRRMAARPVAPLPEGPHHPPRRRIQVALLVFVLVVAVAVPVAVWRTDDGDDGSAPRVGTDGGPVATVGPWTAVPVEGTTLGEAQAVQRLVSTGDALVAVGGVGPQADQDGAIWRSTDGVAWARAEVEGAPGLFGAVGVAGDELLAVSGGNSVDAVRRVHRSTDDGRTWQVIAEGDDLFGPPAPEMYRPFVTSLIWSDAGFWVAGGGSSDGDAGIWTSPDGVRWTGTDLEGNAAGGVDLVTTEGGGYLGHWLTLAWRSTIGAEWFEDRPTIPSGRGLYSVADGSRVALLWRDDGTYEMPRDLARSSDGGRSWTIDGRFLAQHPDAVGETVAQVAGLEVVVGWTAGDSLDDEARGRPGAWASADGGASWAAMPTELREGDLPQQVVMLVAALGDRVVMMSAGRPLDRTYLLDAAALRGPG